MGDFQSVWSEGKKSLEGIETFLHVHFRTLDSSVSEGKKSLEGIETKPAFFDYVEINDASEGKKSLEGIETRRRTLFGRKRRFGSEGKKSLEGIETFISWCSRWGYHEVRRKEIPGRDWNVTHWRRGHQWASGRQKERNPWKGLKQLNSGKNKNFCLGVRRKEIPGRDWNQMLLLTKKTKKSEGKKSLEGIETVFLRPKNLLGTWIVRRKEIPGRDWNFGQELSRQFH